MQQRGGKRICQARTGDLIHDTHHIDRQPRVLSSLEVIRLLLADTEAASGTPEAAEQGQSQTVTVRATQTWQLLSHWVSGLFTL